MIFSTLVDIPLSGSSKYGCFGVYDTDAKRIFLGVTEPNVYTHRCVKQMAAGALLNSNASIAIAVSGNAMPDQTKPEMVDKLGEVFIGIAGYTGENKIKVSTKVYNFCGTQGNELDTCRLWWRMPAEKIKLKNFFSKARNYPDLMKDINTGVAGNEVYSLVNTLDDTIGTARTIEFADDDDDDDAVAPSGTIGTTVADDSALAHRPPTRALKRTEDFAEEHIGSTTLISKFNDFQLTSMISLYIRNATTKQALDDCTDFIQSNFNELIVPSFIDENRIQRTDDTLNDTRAASIGRPYYIINEGGDVNTGSYNINQVVTVHDSPGTPLATINNAKIDKYENTNNKTLRYPSDITIECDNDSICVNTDITAPFGDAVTRMENEARYEV